MGLRTQIQNEIRSVVLASQFPRITYSSSGVASEGASLSPGTILVNEVQSSFEVDKKYGESFREKRGIWQFQILLKFSAEVSLESFEDAMMNNPPSIKVDGKTSALLVLSKSVAFHPPRQQSSNGTEATIAFAVLVR